MRKHISIMFVVAGVLCTGSARAGFITEVTETMMEAQSLDAQAIGLIFGPDDATTLHFTSTTNVATGGFSYSLLPGQTYLGQAISLSTTATYDPALGQFDWTSTGAVGAQGTSAIGSAVWPTPFDPTVTGTTTYGGKQYSFTADVTFSGGSLSEGKYTFTDPQGKTFGPYNGKDTFLAGKWSHTVEVVPGELITLALGNVPFPDGGVGAFDVRILSSVPEPSSLTLAALGVATILSIHRHGLRGRKLPARERRG